MGNACANLSSGIEYFGKYFLPILQSPIHSIAVRYRSHRAFLSTVLIRDYELFTRVELNISSRISIFVARLLSETNYLTAAARVVTLSGKET
jgi:hypothetical protein